MLSLSRLHPAKNGIFQILIFHFRISVLSCALWHQNYVNCSNFCSFMCAMTLKLCELFFLRCSWKDVRYNLHQNYVNCFFLQVYRFFFQYSMCLLFSVLCFVDNCLTYCPFSLGHCIVCSSMYGFWLPLWYLQAFQKELMFNMHSIFWQFAIFKIFP